MNKREYIAKARWKCNTHLEIIADTNLTDGREKRARTQFFSYQAFFAHGARQHLFSRVSQNSTFSPIFCSSSYPILYFSSLPKFVKMCINSCINLLALA